jgi:predicted Zn-dependent peptidase
MFNTHLKIFASILLLVLGSNSFAQKRYSSYETREQDNFSYRVYENDPLQSRIYTLQNGLTVILSQSKEKPRVQTIIATKAGGKNDPVENTGLAHYLEHMLFKGTNLYGTVDFKKEKVFLDQIDELYDTYNSTTDSLERTIIYGKIDSVSLLASNYSIANEYDKMLKSMGAQGTNAFTDNDVTAYINDIPSNQLHKWVEIEAERFRNPILRLFHTELEAVYEEKNISMDDGGTEQYNLLMADLFKNHPYGTQTIIGKINHLKNPSLVAIRDFYKKYYVPNNMVVIMSGDFDYDETIEMINNHFGDMKPGKIDPFNFPLEYPSMSPREYEVVDPEAENVIFGFRFPGATSKDITMLRVIDLLLSNSEAGLIDLNLNKKQRVLNAFCTPIIKKDYSVHYFQGSPVESQTLEQVKDLLLAQIELIKQGKFDEELLQGLIDNEIVDNMKTYESNPGRAYSLLDMFVNEIDYLDFLNAPYDMSKITKEQVIKFAKENYNDDYCVVYKRKGEKKKKVKIAKPEISKVNLNTDKQSLFVKEIMEENVEDIEPVFVDFKTAISFDTIGAVPVRYIENKNNELFSLYYVIDMGRFHDRQLPFSINYLNYLGTDKYTSDEISKKFYSMACTYGIQTGERQSYVYLSGLQKNFDEALELFEHLLTSAVPDKEAFTRLIQNELKKRENNKSSQRYISLALSNYALYGKDNPNNYILSNEELKGLKAEDLVSQIKLLRNYSHNVYYYGPESLKDIKQNIKRHHNIKGFVPTPEVKEFTFLDEKDKVYFVNYDMVQADIRWMGLGAKYDSEKSATVKLFNNYFGLDMSSVVFQNIRESKALAYSTYAYYGEPKRKEEIGKVGLYVGTQADKLEDAIAAMNELIKKMPKSKESFEQARNSLLLKLRSQRINKASILFNYDKNLKLGSEKDLRHPIYHDIENLEFDDIKKFHRQFFKNNDFVYTVMASKDKVSLDTLGQYGKVIELTVDQIFSY